MTARFAYIKFSSKVGVIPLGETCCFVLKGKYAAIRFRKSDTPSRTGEVGLVARVDSAMRHSRAAVVVHKFRATSSEFELDADGAKAVGADSRNVERIRGCSWRYSCYTMSALRDAHRGKVMITDKLSVSVCCSSMPLDPSSRPNSHPDDAVSRAH
jgi:hypothetical protein